VRIANRELCRPCIIPIPLSDRELAIENKHILLAVHNFLDISTAKWGTLGLWLLIQQVLLIEEIIIFLNIVFLAGFLA
jgi:hypothetical protein